MFSFQFYHYSLCYSFPCLKIYSFFMIKSLKLTMSSYKILSWSSLLLLPLCIFFFFIIKCLKWIMSSLKVLSWSSLSLLPSSLLHYRIHHCRPIYRFQSIHHSKIFETLETLYYPYLCTLQGLRKIGYIGSSCKSDAF